MEQYRFTTRYLKEEIRNKLINTHYFIKDNDPMHTSFVVRSKKSNNKLSIAGYTAIHIQKRELPSINLKNKNTVINNLFYFDTCDEIIEWIHKNMDAEL